MPESLALLNDPDWLSSLETFRRRMEITFGEEPSVAMTFGQPVRCAEDVVDVDLSNYLGWHLKARHGALYRWEGDRFQRVAAFGPARQISDAPCFLNPPAALLPWLLDNGLLIRSKLTLAGLMTEEAETLLSELDRLDAHLVAPVGMNEGLWGFLSLGPPLDGSYGNNAALYLGLYGASMLHCLARRQSGLPGPRESMYLREREALWDLERMWESLRPRDRRECLLILDEDPEVLEWMGKYFGRFGFEVFGTISEEAAIRELAERRPPILVVDFSPHWRVPEDFLRAASRIVPEAVIFGSSTSHNERVDLQMLRMGVSQIFRRPCFFARLARAVFEAAIQASVKSGLPDPLRKRRCLVVDDEEEAAALLGGYLETKGFQVQSAGTAEQALLHAESTRPDLVLLDLRLPGMDGAELLLKIREISPLSKVIVLTGWIQEYPEQRLKALQPDAYAVKPVPLEELGRLVEQVQAVPSVG